MSSIYHITDRTDWEHAQLAGAYAADSLITEGFIHCSTAAQVIVTANRLFRGKQGLVLLCIESSKVQAEIRYENLDGGVSLFPHVYGALDTRAIVEVWAFAPGADGTFGFPSAAAHDRGD